METNRDFSKLEDAVNRYGNKSNGPRDNRFRNTQNSLKDSKDILAVGGLIAGGILMIFEAVLKFTKKR